MKREKAETPWWMTACALILGLTLAGCCCDGYVGTYYASPYYVLLLQESWGPAIAGGIGQAGPIPVSCTNSGVELHGSCTGETVSFSGCRGTCCVAFQGEGIDENGDLLMESLEGELHIEAGAYEEYAGPAVFQRWPESQDHRAALGNMESKEDGQ